MRTTTQIAAELKAVAARDKSYNRVVNEGGEGYERDSTAALRAEYKDAEKAEFAAVWTLQVTQARRAAWNAEMHSLVERKVSMTGNVMQATIDKLGYKLQDIQRAKDLHGL